MKYGYIFGLFALILQSTAALALTMPDGRASMAGIPGANPYEKLSNAFAAADPITLYQLPPLEDFQQWTCAGVNENEPMKLSSPFWVPVHVTFKIVLQPATPSTGPLFPGTPEKDQLIDMAILQNPYASDKGDDEDLIELYTKCKVRILSTTPDFVFSSLKDCANPNSGRTTLRKSFRAKDGLLFERSASESSGKRRESYIYCWKTAANTN